jgi:hypothetical protein
LPGVDPCGLDANEHLTTQRLYLIGA